MAKRHLLRSGDLESIIGRLQELVLANSGENDFEEIFKLLIAKLYDELYFQAFPSFRDAGTPAETGQRISKLLSAAHRTWPGIFDDTYESLLTDEHLSICVRELQDENLMDSGFEVLDAAFEFLVSKAAKGNKGQYFTPRYVVRTLVEMVAPRANELIVDPACGSGGFLHQAFNYVRQHQHLDKNEGFGQANLWGFDIDARTVRVAKALMLISKASQSNIIRLNALLSSTGALPLFGSPEDSVLTVEDATRARIKGFKGFDILLSNPPFAGEVKEAHILTSYELYRKGRRIERDVLFMERSLQILRPGGRFAVVLPHNKVGGSNWMYLREWLLQHARIIGVLGLGRHTFLPHTHQKTSVLIGIKRERPLRQIPDEEILFMLSEKDGKDSRGQILIRGALELDKPIWTQVDHDLTDFVPVFHKFVRAQAVAWGK